MADSETRAPGHQSPVKHVYLMIPTLTQTTRESPASERVANRLSVERGDDGFRKLRGARNRHP
jgi:hypothetical protein